MTAPKASQGREPVECPRVHWEGERVEQRFPTHGAEECRAVGRGIEEAHACRRRAGHEEDHREHVCYCGLTWSADGAAAGFGPSRSPRSDHRDHQDRSIVITEIGIVITRIGPS